MERGGGGSHSAEAGALIARVMVARASLKELGEGLEEG